MQVERVSQTRITAAKTLPDLFQGVRDFLSEGRKRMVSISPHCLRRNEYTLSFSFKSGEGTFESETLRTPLDFAGKMFKRGVERIVIRSGVLDADLSALVRVLENDFARISLREFSRPQIKISFIKLAPTPAAAPETRQSVPWPSAAPAPKLIPEPHPPIEPAPIPALAPTPAPVQPASTLSQATQEPDTLLVAGILNNGKRINRELMQGLRPELEAEMRKWIEQAEVAIRAYNEFTQTHKTPALLRQRPIFSDLRQRIRSFKQRLKDNSETPEVV